MSDYPDPQTVIYPAYCYSNFSKSIFSIGCTTQLLLCLSALTTALVVAYFLFRLYKAQQTE